MYQTILVPLDGSQRAEKILPYVEELAHKFGSQLIFLQVVEPIVAVAAPYEAAPIYYNDDLDQRMAAAKEYLAGLQKQFHVKGLEIKTLIDNNPVVGSIIEIAEREQAELIAMASHGRTGLGRVFYGSVAAGVLHRADRPLLLIRTQD